MSPASQRVAAFGFQHTIVASRMVSDVLSGSAEVHFGGSTIEFGEAHNARALLLGPDFDFHSSSSLEAARKAVENGSNIIVIGLPSTMNSPSWFQLLGARPVAAKPSAEWFFKVRQSELAITQRISNEFTAVGDLTILEIKDDCEPLLETSIAFADQVTATIKIYPTAHVVTFGYSPSGTTLSPEVATIIKRATTLDAEMLIGSSTTLGVGIVGYGPFGGMGHYHGKAANDVAGLSLVAVVDRDAERRKAAEFEFPNIRTYKTIEELVEDGEVDICVVATPPVSHAEISKYLLEQGKHVICEKPMCLTSVEANELIEIAKTTGKMLTINQNRRWDRDFRALYRAVKENKLGEIFNIETFVGGFEHPCRAWHSEETISGGAIYDWGSHHIDWIVQLYGSAPNKVSATSHKRVWHDVTNVDQIKVHLLWDDGREAEFFQSDIAALRKPKFFVQGTKGTVRGNYRPIIKENVEFPFGYEEHEYHHAEAPATLLLSRYESGYGLVEETLPPAKAQPFAFHQNVANHLLLGEPLRVTPKEAAEVIAILEAAQLSSISGSQYISLGQK